MHGNRTDYELIVQVEAETPPSPTFGKEIMLALLRLSLFHETASFVYGKAL
jgi:hypothetical protein